MPDGLTSDTRTGNSGTSFVRNSYFCVGVGVSAGVGSAVGVGMGVGVNSGVGVGVGSNVVVGVGDGVSVGACVGKGVEEVVDLGSVSGGLAHAARDNTMIKADSNIRNLRERIFIYLSLKTFLIYLAYSISIMNIAVKQLIIFLDIF